MKKYTIALLLITAFIVQACKEEYSSLPDGLYAAIKTSKGDIIVQLDPKKAPITVANFITLAEGKNSFVSSSLKGKRFYDGLMFHRVIPDFMIQGGDPLGNGSGDAGYLFKDEISDLKFDQGGMLAMANAGPGTNSSQFFITHLATPWLDGRHTIFGKVIGNGMEVVNTIVQDDKIDEIEIIRNGSEAKKFDAVKVFSDYYSVESKNREKQALIDAENKKKFEAQYKIVKEQKAAYFKEAKSIAQKTKSGLLYKIIKKGTGKKPQNGNTVYIHYAGFLENGELFDSSLEDVSKTFGKFDQRRSDAKQYLPIPFELGRKDGMIPGFIEGIEKLSFGDKALLFIPSHLAYGAQGAGDVIPPNTPIIFEIELLENMPK